MKTKVMLTVLFFLLLKNLSAQIDPATYSYTGIYRWATALTITNCNFNGTAVANPTIVQTTPNQLFWVVNVVGNDAIIKFLYYTALDGQVDATKSERFYKYNFSGDANKWDTLDVSIKKAKKYGADQLYFKVPLTAVQTKAVPYKRINWSLAIGALNFPFKYRFQKGLGDFAGSFNLGTGVGLSIPHDSAAKWNYHILAGFSLSQINIDSAAASRNWSGLQKNNDFSAFSLSLGIMLQHGKAQVGAFIGWDRLGRLNDLEYGWLYQGKPWVSIAFGYSIFSFESKSTKETEIQK